MGRMVQSAIPVEAQHGAANLILKATMLSLSSPYEVVH